jgi:meso-butanediol dehydrogenase/(S,S)-butanediol dehydrogenase/diacetyl reductase
VSNASPAAAVGRNLPDLGGKVVIITGGATGIGRAGALRFAAAGARVAIADLSDATRVVQEIAATGLPQARAYTVDVGDPAQVEKLIADVEGDFGRIDVLYANAGIHHWGDATETELDDWAASLAVNLSGVFYLAKYGIPALHRVGGGVIVTTASEYGLLGARRSVGYCATKAGIINLTRALAVDHADQNIRANCIVPGPIATERGLALFQEDPGLAEAQDRLILLGRNGEPSEIASVAAFLASDQSSFMTGSVVRVDGGATSWYSV